MSIVFEEALGKDLASGYLSNVYLLFGNDTYLKKHYCDQISSKAYTGDPLFNLHKFEGNCLLQDVYNSVNQFALMADSKCVVLTDYDFEHCSKSDFDMLSQLISTVESGCVFIMRFDAIEFDYKKSSRAKKLIESVECVGGKAVCLDHRNHNVLARMLINAASKRNCSLNESDAHFLIQTVGDDLSLLKNELNKLCSYVNNGKINKDIIKEVSVKSIESSIYDYVQEIISCNLSSALKVLDDLFYMRVEPMIILHTASSMYVDLYRVFAARKNSNGLDVVSKDFSYKNKAFVLKRALSNINKIDFKKIVLSFEALLKADEHLKSFGYDARTVLEELTVKLVYIIIKGESVD